MLSQKHIDQTEPQEHGDSKQDLDFLKATYNNSNNAIEQKERGDANESDVE